MGHIEWLGSEELDHWRDGWGGCDAGDGGQGGRQRVGWRGGDGRDWGKRGCRRGCDRAGGHRRGNRDLGFRGLHRLLIAVGGHQDELGRFIEIESLMSQGGQVGDGFVPQRADIEHNVGEVARDQPIDAHRGIAAGSDDRFFGGDRENLDFWGLARHWLWRGRVNNHLADIAHGNLPIGS